MTSKPREPDVSRETSPPAPALDEPPALEDASTSKPVPELIEVRPGGRTITNLQNARRRIE